MSGKNGVPYGGSVPTTVLKALTEIQMVAADIVSVTTCTNNATFYEPALQARLTSNAVYKRYISVKVSAQSNTAGTISVELRNVTQGTSGTAVTVVIAGGQENVEKAIAATTVTAQATNLGDVFTIRVKHSVNGATVTLNSGGMMEADLLTDLSTNTSTYIAAFNGVYLNSWKYMSLAGLTTAAVTIQPAWRYQFAGGYFMVNLGSSSSVLNSSITVTGLLKFTYAATNISLNLISSGIASQVLLGQAIGVSADNI